MTTEDVVTVLKALSPEFTTVRGCIILAREGPSLVPRDEWVSEWLVQMNGNISQAEDMMNHRHVYDLIHQEGYEADYTDEDLLLLASVYCAVLERSLRIRFPHETFKVEMRGEELLATDGTELIVTFYRPEETLKGARASGDGPR